MLSTGRLVGVSVACALAAVLTVPAAAARSAAQPRMLLTTKAPIRAFAQDSSRIAWIGAKWHVESRKLGSNAKTVPVGKANPIGVDDGVPPRLLLAGSRVFWTRTGGGNDFETSVWAQRAGARAVRQIVFFTTADREERNGTYFGGLAAGSSTVAFDTVDYECVDPDNCSELAAQPSGVNGLFRILGASRSEQVTGTPGALALAVGSGRVALLRAPAEISPTQIANVAHPQLAQPGATVEIRSATTGELISQFTPPGTVRALALAGTVAAVVDELPDGTRTIERYDVNTGAMLNATAGGIAVGNTLSGSGNSFVFCVGGGKIESMSASTGALKVLAISHGPIGLSVVGNRVAWAVNAHGRGRVLALTLP